MRAPFRGAPCEWGLTGRQIRMLNPGALGQTTDFIVIFSLGDADAPPEEAKGRGRPNHRLDANRERFRVRT